VNTLRYWHRLTRMFIHYLRKSTILPYLPVRLWVELTSACNYRCIMCPNKDLKKEDRGFMGIRLYRKIIDEAARFAFDVNLAHRGESLLHPRIIEAITYAKEKGLFTRLHTNGSLLDEDLSSRILRSGLDRLSFSFDGYDKETYERIRRGGDFERTVENIIRFLKMKKKIHSRKPVTAIEVIAFGKRETSGLPDAAAEFKRRFRGLPLDNFVVKEMHNWAGGIQAKGKGKKYTVCPFPWNALILYWDGSVLPCTQDFFGSLIIGDAGKDSLEEIWNGEKMRHLRKMLASRRVEGLPSCSDCDRLWRESILGIPREYLWRFITRRMP